MSKDLVFFGQVVLGPPGSGKTTYCYGMQQFLTALNRQVFVINLDPANENIPYTCDVNMADLIRLEEVMDELGLGPNGGMVYCMEYLEQNVGWLVSRILECVDASSASKPQQAPYLLFDLPGQVELVTHHSSLHTVLAYLLKELDLRLCAVHLVDSFHCADPAQFISAVFLSLSSMLRLELPHVNVLSKIDLLESRGSLDFGLDFYTETSDLEHLLPLIPSGLRQQRLGGKVGSVEETMKAATEESDDVRPMREDKHKAGSAFAYKYRKLNEALCKLVEDYQLVSFQTLNIEDKDSVYELLKYIDKTLGYVESSGVAGVHGSADQRLGLQERYTPSNFQ